MLTLNKYDYIKQEEFNRISDQRWKIVAILVNKKPISVATNSLRKTNVFTSRFNSDRKMHAEIRCIMKSPRSKVKNSTLYIWRLNKNNKYCNSRPCEMCMKFIKDVGIKKIIYTTDDNYGEERI